MIRSATPADLDAIVELGSRSLLDGPYREQIKDKPEVTRVLARQIIQNPQGKVLVLEHEGKIEGVLAFIVFAHYFDAQPTGGELIFYVQPEHRQKYPFDALALMSMAEKVAKESGAEWMQFTAPTPEVAALYEKKHYAAVETTYRKRLI